MGKYEIGNGINFIGTRETYEKYVDPTYVGYEKDDGNSHIDFIVLFEGSYRECENYIRKNNRKVVYGGSKRIVVR